MSEKVLVLDDDEQLRKGLATYLRRVGFDVVEAGNVAEAQKVLSSDDPDVAIVDYQLPDGTAFDVLDVVRERDAGESVIVLTGAGTIDLAVTAIKSGAEHFLTKPVDLGSLEVLVRRALEARRERRLRALSSVGTETPPNPFLGSSRVIRELETLTRTAAEAEVPLLLLGETGSGKGVLARFIHESGPRKSEAFVDVNCAGLSRERGESELFGYQRGAFAGAVMSKPGLFEVAHRGSLFLDEIGDLELGMQPKLSKAIEEGRFRRLGEVGSRSVNVRLIAATHKNLGAMVKEATFREDLLFRVNALTLKVPALRERPVDIPILAGSLLSAICARRGRPTLELAPDAASLLSQYSWPGNVRELRNVLERAVLFSSSDRLDRNGLRFDRALEPDGDDDLGQTLDDAERRHIAQVLARTGGRVEDAAEALAVSRSALYAKLKKYGLKASGS